MQSTKKMEKMPGDQFCLRWNNHQPNLISVFSSLLQNDQMVDVTLILDNREIHAHKIVLSACSPFFQVDPFFFFRIKFILFVYIEKRFDLCVICDDNCVIVFQPIRISSYEMHANIQSLFWLALNTFI